jgi:DNA-binding SARP family transcriptional activator
MLAGRLSLHHAAPTPEPSRPSGCDRMQIRLLGPFEIVLGDRPVSLRGHGKFESLLSYLALRDDHPVARDELVRFLWPDVEGELAVQSLNGLVHRIHKRFAPALGGAAAVENRGLAYSLNRDAGVGTDVALFDSWVTSGEQSAARGDHAAAADAFETALILYRGDLSPGDDLRALIERERLRARYLTLLARQADYYVAAAMNSLGLTYALRLLACDPCREDGHRLAMRCYTRLGERAQALRQFHLCCKVLKTEFNASPEAATMALFEEVRSYPEAV